MQRLFLILLVAIGLWPNSRALAVPVDIDFADGELNVATDTFADRNVRYLEGNWHYYHNQIIGTNGPCPSTTDKPIPVLANWWNERLIGPNAAIGLHSFCMIVHNPERLALSLWWPERVRFDFYVNGRLLEGTGELKDRKGLGGTDRQSPVIHLPDAEQLIMVVHADNSFMTWRKTKSPIYIGLTPTIHNRYSVSLIFQAALFGALLMTGAYQLVLFLLHRERRETLYLGLFCVIVGLRSGSLGRSNIHSVLAPWLLGHWNFSVGFIGYFFASAAFYQFLRINYPLWTSAKLAKVYWILAPVLSIVCLAFGPPVYNNSLLIFHVPAFLGMASAPYFVFQAVRHRYRGAWIIFAGTLLLSVSAIHDMIRSQGFGLSFDVLDGSLLSLVFVASVLISIRFLHAFEMLSQLSRELSKIVPFHVIKKLKAGERLETTMPVGEAEAVILVFDVVGSSRVDAEGFRHCLDLCLARFFNCLNENYDPEKQEAIGYRLKELGDGLICSIGFPFPVPGQLSNEQTAFALAERFCTIFAAETSRLALENPVYCGIGLAKGKVEGFFPRSGQKQYDLRGAPLTMATRYESMRNLVYRIHGVKGSVIFVQEAVYQGLSAEQQASLQFWDARAPQQKIRDDDGAERAWFKFFNPNP